MEKNYFLRKIEIIFSKDLLLFLKKIILFFLLFWKNLSFYEKKINFDPFFRADSTSNFAQKMIKCGFKSEKHPKQYFEVPLDIKYSC